MRRFTIVVCAYLSFALVCAIALVVRGDGPHPRVTTVIPPNGARYFPGGPVEITFSHEMDQSTVERGLRVSPAYQGQGAWYGSTLNIQPLGDWHPDTTYRVSLSGKVADTEGRALPTPFSFGFRVHHIGRVGLCRFGGVRNVCELTRGYRHALTFERVSVQESALSGDRSELAYIRRDAENVPHLFVLDVATRRVRQLTSGSRYADARPRWNPGDVTSITYSRREVATSHRSSHTQPPHLWNINIDGSNNLQIR